MNVQIQIAPARDPEGHGAVLLAVAIAGVGIQWLVPCEAIDRLCSDLKQAKAEAEGNIILAPAGAVPRTRQ